MIKTPALLRVNIDSHPSGILIHIAMERLFSSLESAGSEVYQSHPQCPPPHAANPTHDLPTAGTAASTQVSRTDTDHRPGGAECAPGGRTNQRHQRGGYGRGLGDRRTAEGD